MPGHEPRTTLDLLQYATIRIEAEHDDGKTAYGTGFFFNFHNGPHALVPAVVTNRHVVAGATRLRFKVHVGDIGNGTKLTPTGRSEWFSVEMKDARWEFHPDPDVDLAAMPFLLLEIEACAQLNGLDAHEMLDRFAKGELSEDALGPLRPYTAPLTEDHLVTSDELQGLDVVEDVIMVGYPNRLWDEVNNLPIFRQGATASKPSVAWNGKPWTLLDAATFPGSSGSPVFLARERPYASEWRTRLGSRPALLGVVFGVFEMTHEGVVVQNIPTSPRAETSVPMHLGVIVQAQQLRMLGAMLRAQGLVLIDKDEYLKVIGMRP